MTATATDQEMELNDSEPFRRLSKDLRAAAKMLGKAEARFLVDLYYTLQHNRIRSDAQVRAHSEGAEPNKLLSWCAESFRYCENDVRAALNVFAREYTVGLWMQGVCGVGPVISAGLLAHLQIAQAPTYGHFWAFAGLDSTERWEKGKKRPWNADLKCLVAFKLGECFVKVQNRPQDYYGGIYVRRKARELEMNQNKRFEAQARAQIGDEDALADCTKRGVVIKCRNIGKTTEAYKHLSQGMLPPAQIHARARRYAVKLFLAHLFHVMFEDFHGRKPMCPYPFEKLGHDPEHYLPPPNWPMQESAKNLRDMLA